MEFSRPEYWSGSLSLLQGIFPNQGSSPGLPHWRQIFLPAETPGKPKNTGVGSWCFLQQIFSTQELNWGLLHCRWILYQLRHQGSPIYKMDLYKWCFLDTNITVCRQIGQLMAPSHEPYRQYATMQVPNGKKRSILMLLSPYIPRKFHIFEIF